MRTKDCGEVFEVTLEYPRSREKKRIRVCLSDVRAADFIEIEYDFERDGWKIMKPFQGSYFADDPEPPEREVGFIEDIEWEEVH